MTGLRLVLGHPDGDLTILGHPDRVGLGHGAWVTRLTLPNRTWRRGYAPPSNYFAGQVPLTAVLDATALAAVISVKAPDSIELAEEVDHIEVVVAQFQYAVTTETETRSTAWLAEPADITYGDYVVGSDRMSATQLVISFPVNPI